MFTSKIQVFFHLLLHFNRHIEICHKLSKKMRREDRNGLANTPDIFVETRSYDEEAWTTGNANKHQRC